MFDKKPVKPFKVYLKCDKCGGNMIFTGRGLPVNPMKYEHKCENCGEILRPNKVYPSIEYEE